MKKAIAWLLVLALTAAVSIGATLAYLTDTDEDVNVMTLGQVKIDQLEYERIDDETKDEDAKVQEFHDNKPLYPGVYEDGFDFGTEDNYVNWDQIGKDEYTSGIWNPDEINNELDKMVFVKNKGDYDAYVRTVFAFEAGNYTTLEEFQKMVHLNLNDTDWTWEWAETPVAIPNADGSETTNYFIATATYNKVLTPDALTEISLSQIALDKTATNADVEAFGETYQVLVKTQAIQADGFSDPDTALTEGFGEVITNVGTQENPELAIDSENVPFENDNPIEGTDLWTALHYLDGDKNGTQITTAVNSVTFGLNRDYTDIVDNYDGTLVDVEQDVPVYAYYVPSTSTYARAASSNYDVYFLANDDIYTPVDSSGLFCNMTVLTEVNTGNLNTGRTENFFEAFRYCSSLQSIDASDWDVSSLKTAESMFRECTSLVSADCSGWNAKSLNSVRYMFGLNKKLKTVNVTGWNTPVLTDASNMFREDNQLQSIVGIKDVDVSNVTSLASTFRKCHMLSELDLTGWNAVNVEKMSYTFQQCRLLEEIPGLDGFDVSKVTTMQGAFWGCSNLKELDLSTWNPCKVTDMYHMFSECTSLSDLGDVSNWNLESVTTTYGMFNKCSSLTELDATNWKMPNNSNMGFMFNECSNLKTIKSTNWMLGSVDAINSCFMFCTNLVNIDTANWNTATITNMESMFRGCLSLQKVDVSNWDVSKVTNFNSMFSGAISNSNDMALTEINVSNWNPTSATHMNHMFYGCAQLTELNMSGWNMPNLYTTSHMFADCANLTTIDVSGWYTPKLYSMDAMFNQCEKVECLNVSSFDTANVKEFSQVFEGCKELEVIEGLTNWNTSNGKVFDQMFFNCESLQELDLSSFNTSSAQKDYKALNGDMSKGFWQTFDGMKSLTKLTLGENFDFDGNSTVSHKVSLPNPAGEGTQWYNEANGVYYEASDIPEPNPGEDPVTYVVAVPPANP